MCDSVAWETSSLIDLDIVRDMALCVAVIVVESLVFEGEGNGLGEGDSVVLRDTVDDSELANEDDDVPDIEVPPDVEKVKQLKFAVTTPHTACRSGRLTALRAAGKSEY